MAGKCKNDNGILSIWTYNLVLSMYALHIYVMYTQQISNISHFLYKGYFKYNKFQDFQLIYK